MPTIIDALSRFPEFPGFPEQLPDWLQEFSPSFNREGFFASRTLYYPGSGFDGHPIRICSKARAVHTFVYVDNWEPAGAIVSRVKKFRGYDIEHLENLDEEQLVGPNGWMTPHGDRLDGFNDRNWTDPYYLYAVLHRNPGFVETHGPEKLAILFIGRDGFETFDILYCSNNGIRPPYLIVVENRSITGGSFENKGQLHNYARWYGALPSLLLVGDGSIAWDGYQYTGACEFPGTDGAMFNDRLRYLYARPCLNL